MTKSADHNDHIADQETFVVLSVAPQDYAQFRENYPNAKEVQGCYNGAREASWVVSVAIYTNMLRCGYLDTQESVLVLGPKPHYSAHRPATLHFLHWNRLPENLGYFVPQDDDDDDFNPNSVDAWTFDPVNGTYYVCEHPEA